ncbi:MAG: phage tail tape measure protein, partial [Armatimonadota bacterium]|nr:phage tail tape measure protein [Armatimonadota bacterium]
MADATVTIQMLFQAAGQENVRRALQEIHNEVRRLAAQSPRAAVFRTAGPAGEAFADLRNRLAAVRAMAAQMRAATQAVQQQIVTLKQTGAEVALTPAEIRMATARLAEIMSGRALFGRAPAGIAEALFGPEQLRAFHQGRERFERQIHDFIRQTGPSLGRMLRVGLDPSLVQGQLDAIHAIMTSRSMSIAERMRAAGTVMQGLVRSAFADPHLRRDLQDTIRQLTDWSTALEEAAAAGDQGAARLQRSLFRRFQEIQRILVGLAGAITTPRQALREMAEISRMTAVPESGFVRMLNEARAAGVSAGEIIGRVWVPSLERSIRVASLGTQSIRGYADQLADIAQRWAEMGEAGPARVREIAAQIGAELSRVTQVIRMRGRELSIPFATALAADLAQISRHAQAAVRSIERAPGVPQVILPRAQQLRELAGRLEEINRALAGVERTAGRGFMLRLGQELIAVTRQTWTVHQLAMAFRSTGMDIAFMGAAILGTGSAMALAAQNVARIMRTFEVTAGIPARMALQAREAMLRLGAEIGAGGEQVGQAMAVWARATGEVIATQDDLERVVARVAPVMALASIHGENMADVLARVVAAANIFRIGLDDLSRIVAVFNKVAIETPTTLIEIGDALRFVGPVARNAGASFEQVMAILQLAAAEGLRGGVAGRALRQMFIRFGESEQETRRLVRAVFGQAEPFFPGGRFIGLPRFIEMIARASEQMSEMQRAQMMAQLATANELPLLESLVALQQEAARWARERGRAEFNVIEALEDAHRGIASQRALLLQEFLRETRGIQIEIRSAAEQWDQTFQRFVEHTATRWDRAMARLRGSLQVVGFGVQEFLVGNLERAAGAAESLIRVLGGAERAATLLGGALGRIAMFGFGVMGIG